MAQSAPKKLKTDVADDGGENSGKGVYGAPAQLRDVVGYGASRVSSSLTTLTDIMNDLDSDLMITCALT
jgi:hypothetical protein